MCLSSAVSSLLFFIFVFFLSCSVFLVWAMLIVLSYSVCVGGGHNTHYVPRMQNKIWWEGEVTAPLLPNGPLSPSDWAISGKIPSHLKEDKSHHVIESGLHYDEHTVWNLCQYWSECWSEIQRRSWMVKILLFSFICCMMYGTKVLPKKWILRNINYL